MMNKTIWCMALAMIGSIGALGCSKASSVTPDAGASGSAGTTAAGASGGSAGAAGGTAGTAANRMGGRAPVVVLNVPCGDTKCAGTAPPDPNSPMSRLGFTPAQVCCADDSTSTCGAVNMTTNMCEAYPLPAPKCPATFGMGGCCVDGNLCGADLSLYGMGCRELGSFGMMVPGGRRGFAMLAPPTHCDGTPVPMPDAGMSEADAGQ